jgi:hypothetical protein
MESNLAAQASSRRGSLPTIASAFDERLGGSSTWSVIRSRAVGVVDDESSLHDLQVPRDDGRHLLGMHEQAFHFGRLIGAVPSSPWILAFVRPQGLVPGAPPTDRRSRTGSTDSRR